MTRRPCSLLVAAALLAAAGCSTLGSIFRDEPAVVPLGALGDEVSRTGPSGLRVVIQEARTAPVVALELVVSVGSADDPEATPGVARALDHVVVAGSALERLVAARGGRLEAWTTHDETHLAVTVPADAFAETVRALGAAALAPTFSPDELDRQIGAMVAEVRRSRAEPERLALEELFAATFAGTPWARPPIGTVEGLAHLGVGELRRFHAANWVPAHMTLSIVGAVDVEDAFTAADQAFSRRGAALPAAHERRPVPRLPDAPRLVVRADAVPDASLAIGFRVDDATPDELAALEVALALLTADDDARIPTALARAGLSRAAGDAGGVLHVLRGPAVLLVWAGAVAGRAPAAVETMLGEAYRLGRAAPTPAELRRAVAAIAAADARARDGMPGLAATLAARATRERARAAREAAQQGLPSAEAVRAAAARLLVPARTVAVAVVPAERAAAARSALEGAAERASTRAAAHLAHGEDTALPGGVRREVLANGARVLVAPDPRAPLVAVRVALVGGARLENAALAGSSALLARLMARTAAAAGPSDGRIAGFSGRDTFGLEGSFRRADVGAGLAALARGLVAPALEPGAIEEARRSLGLSARDARTDALAVALRRAAGLLYGTHPYASDPAGTPEGLAALDGPRLATFLTRALAADRLVIAVAGDTRFEVVAPVAREQLGGLPRGTSVPEPGAPDGATTEETVELASGRSAVVVALPGARWGTPEHAPLEVAAAVLDERLRALEERGLLAMHFARHVPGAIGGDTEVGASVAADNAVAAREAILAEVARLRGERVDDDELARARGAVAGRAALSVDELGARAAALAFAELAGDAALVASLPARLAAVGADDVRDVVGRRWPAGSERVVIAGPAPPEPAPPPPAAR